MKKIVSLILALCLVAGMLPLMVFAQANAVIANGNCGNGLTWELTGDGVMTITGNGSLDDITADTPWSDYNKKITSVIIGAGVTDIDNIAFFNLKKLTSINVDVANASYTSIDGVLYTKDGKTMVAYPAGKVGTAYTVADGTEAIDSYAFRSCEKLVSVIIPDSVTAIGNYLFWGCKNIETVTIGSGVSAIGTWAFAYCDSLTAIEVSEANANYTSVDGVLYTADMKALVSYPAAKTATTFAVSGGVNKIANYAFYGCDNLATITVPAGVTSIGNNVFNYCDALTAVNVAEGNTKYTSVDGVLYNKAMTTLLYYPAGKTDAEFTVPEKVITIGKSAFENCDNLETVNMGKNVNTLGYAAFAYCDSLATINYANTDAKWNKMDKGSYWDHYLGDYAVTTSEPIAITNADMTVAGTAKKNADGTVTVGGGSANRAYLSGGYQGAHFAMNATFTIPEGSNKFSFAMGKDRNDYGYFAELTVREGKSYVDIHKEVYDSVTNRYTVGLSSSYELPFDLSYGKEYTLTMTFDILSSTTGGKRMTTEVFGEDGEYYTCATSCNGYGNPFYYSGSASCVVSDFSLSLDHYYDVTNAKVAVFGHSFVEADTMGANRSQGFAFLLETELEKKYGKGTVYNFGLGGDTVSGMYNKIVNSARFLENCEYALLCIGTNDRGSTSAAFLATLQKAIKALEDMGITPILFTVPHGNYEMNANMIAENDWIRSSGYNYVDMYDIFANADGSCKTNLFLTDKIHPTLEGQRLIFERIKTDCPFLFN